MTQEKDGLAVIPVATLLRSVVHATRRRLYGRPTKNQCLSVFIRGSAFRQRLRHRVITAFAGKWMAARKAPQPKESSLNRPVFSNGLNEIIAASRNKSALPPKIRRKYPLIKSNEQNQNPRGNAHHFFPVNQTNLSFLTGLQDLFFISDFEFRNFNPISLILLSCPKFFL